ncbi:multinuclear nonheme iron-dependent oxidase [Jeotgalibacillus terrae]|uniref:DUF692 family multinuclear iron-containing protein n=1 Tax=Jeotgalibacillus terrae TaxID=587735 RepID=A0ABW5ZKF1_9BACL|nr:DUF692 family multinuclear iron-containing protein [Jeotgalibacillus terrae]MBM7578167.1 uncharacterized protein (UPF0276 family) [Jeotgalibacillus terrae]
MKVAVNYSVEAKKLLTQSLIDIDLFKCPDFSDELIESARESKPSYIHFGLNAGSGQMGRVDWGLIRDMQNRTQTPYINVHAVAMAKHYPDMDVETEQPSHINKMVDAILRDIEILDREVGAENVIVENVICRGQGENMMRAAIDPEVLTRIVKETGCGFLLDTAHAQMSAKSLGFDVKEYISSLPVNHLKELHVTGIQPDGNGRLRDSMPMTAEDWELASWVVEKIRNGEWQKPWIAALEYGGVGPAFEWRSEEKVLAEQVPAFNTMVKGER